MVSAGLHVKTPAPDHASTAGQCGACALEYRYWRESALDRMGLDELELSFAAHFVAQLSGVVRHARCETDAADGHSAKSCSQA